MPPSPLDAAPRLLYNSRSNVVRSAALTAPRAPRALHFSATDSWFRPACGAHTLQLHNESLVYSPPLGSCLCLRGACASTFDAWDGVKIVICASVWFYAELCPCHTLHLHTKPPLPLQVVLKLTDILPRVPTSWIRQPSSPTWPVYVFETRLFGAVGPEGTCFFALGVFGD